MTRFGMTIFLRLLTQLIIVSHKEEQMKNILQYVRCDGFLFVVFCLFTSTNSLQAQWIQTGPYGGDVNSFFVSGTNIYAGAFGNGVFLSTNNGTNWSALPGTGLTSLNVMGVVLSGTNLFAGVNRAGMFLSTDNSTSWTAVNNGLTSNIIDVLALSGANLFVGTYGGYGGGVFVLTNNGTSWTGSLSPMIINAFAFSGINAFAGTNAGVFLSTNTL